MPWNNTMMQLMADAARSAAVGIQLHSAAAGVDGTANATTAGRETIPWAAAHDDGDWGLSTVIAFTGGAASGDVYSATVWSTDTTGGTFYGEFLLTGDASFNAAGEFKISSFNTDGTAS